MKLSLLLVALLISSPTAALAGPAADAVKFFYAPEVKFEADAQFRDRFTQPVTKLFELNDQAIRKNPDQLPCIDFNPGLDAQDFDQAEINKSLKLSEAVKESTAEVTATFTLFPDDGSGEGNVEREMLWLLKNIDGKWRITDISSRTNNWTLSELRCMIGDDTD